jgi:hypothetical protein
VFDNQPVNTKRRWLAAATLVIFIISASLTPTRL